MSPEFYAIIGVGISTIGVLSGLMMFLFNQLSQRMDRLETRMNRMETRMDRLEEKFDRLLEQTHSLDLRVSKLEWMLDAALQGKPVSFPQEADDAEAAD